MPPIHELFGNNFLKIFFQTKSFAGLLLLFFRLIFSGLFRFSNKMFCFSYFECKIITWGCSSVVEHLTADQEVPGSNPGAPSKALWECLTFNVIGLTMVIVKLANMCSITANQSWIHHLTLGLKDLLQKAVSRGWFRSIDLWVMGPARFRCATLLFTTPDGTRTHNPCLRRAVPYPLGHWGYIM